MIIMVASVARLQNVRHGHGDVYNFERAFFYRAGRGKSADIQGGAKQQVHIRFFSRLMTKNIGKLFQAFPRGRAGRLFFLGAGPASQGVHPWWQW